jgi:hypothetical protein
MRTEPSFGGIATTAAPADWLDRSNPTVDVLNIGNSSSSAAWVPYSNTWHTYTEPRKIRLKLSEVERLREAAREDEALKAVLQKFTGHIEIEVDFA